jgi:ribosomal protein S18 acetylase RimI-like enzyme
MTGAMRGDPKLLERPVWSALTTAHAGFARGNDLARRYLPDVAPMCSVRQVSDACLQALAALMAPGDIVGLFSAEPVTASSGLAVLAQKFVEQMVYEGGEVPPAADAGAVAKLTPDDVSDMMRLVDVTQPGPFAPRTIALGTYIGIRSAGTLIAMAGERMKFDGFTEISAVCTHPAHRGRGYASVLVRTLMRQILQRGETPFLHVYHDNTGAAAIYEKLGFAHRRSIGVTVLRTRETNRQY